MALPQPRRLYTPSGLELPGQLRTERRKSIPVPLNFTTMEDAIARWEQALQATTSNRQRVREALRVAVNVHAKICEEIGPLARRERVMMKLRMKKDADRPLHILHLEVARKDLSRLTTEQHLVETQVSAVIRGFYAFTTKSFSHFDRQDTTALDPQTRLEYDLDLARLRLNITNILCTYDFSERTYTGDSARLMGCIWEAERGVSKRSKFAYEAQKAVQHAETELAAAEGRYIKAFDVQRDAVENLAGAMSAANAGRKAQLTHLHAEAVRRWVALCKSLFTDYPNLETFPKPPPYHTCQSRTCEAQKTHRALGCESGGGDVGEG
ncbi:hypothetical protein CLAFUW4_10955 [Fulvia fulva]|uniref:Uncharacterized protein n=1 Tax=Passalora fulva TaxID=5499 RepID=A0A9Q8PDE9_PASFU|nr:uncharacterized protein CLAFUR5_09997 [Fulvia fulva]KAK4620188.1 hypothetical protein CLAFUR4_10960 [Fulvia fulva]KAK4620405.1 hypothetical protein CLAFUR0_10967 [Fulvia fulva]UJO20419.1 hypothetical protein CLAFUR5_09997 [Fulvia fulva]WPV17033.1 hypothetical protein CLAFUW4_10955 [Fulvia fulva]WPV32420.1 hypothetical protein CLAFUW7_10953 [Fulvia fulva]